MDSMDWMPMDYYMINSNSLEKHIGKDLRLLQALSQLVSKGHNSFSEFVRFLVAETLQGAPGIVKSQNTEIV